MNDYKYLIDSNGNKRKRTADDASAPIITPAFVDVGKIWAKRYKTKITVSQDLESLLKKEN